ncbi:MAG TPA: Panacea domain-containing protein [Acetobacteraceae bacterium]|jgi:hypothetical protein
MAVAARYAVHTAKALETIVWLANANPGIDIYHVVKGAFYADKYHLNKYGRPISGDDYQADTYGPLGQSVYRLLNGDPIEMLALGGNGPLPFAVGDRWQVTADREANGRLLSASDVEALTYAIGFVRNLSFDDLVRLTHEEGAYIAADGGRMRYEDLLDEDDPRRKEKADDLAETARFAVF